MMFEWLTVPLAVDIANGDMARTRGDLAIFCIALVMLGIALGLTFGGRLGK